MVMTRPLVPVILAIVAISLSGCGTFCNFGAAVLPPDKDPTGWPRIYGGVQMDASVVSHLGDNPAMTANESMAKLAGIGLLAADGLASAVADTLTLPITIPLDMARHPRNYEKPKEPGDQVEIVSCDGIPEYRVKESKAGAAPLSAGPGTP
jgi:hypothetical protein